MSTSLGETLLGRRREEMKWWSGQSQAEKLSLGAKSHVTSIWNGFPSSFDLYCSRTEAGLLSRKPIFTWLSTVAVPNLEVKMGEGWRLSRTLDKEERPLWKRSFSALSTYNVVGRERSYLRSPTENEEIVRAFNTGFEMIVENVYQPQLIA